MYRQLELDLKGVIPKVEYGFRRQWSRPGGGRLRMLTKCRTQELTRRYKILPLLAQVGRHTGFTLARCTAIILLGTRKMLQAGCFL